MSLFVPDQWEEADDGVGLVVLLSVGWSQNGETQGQVQPAGEQT